MRRVHEIDPEICGVTEPMGLVVIFLESKINVEKRVYIEPKTRLRIFPVIIFVLNCTIIVTSNYQQCALII